MRTIVLGGVLRHTEYSLIGGITLDEVEVKQALVQAAREVVVQDRAWDCAFFD